MSTPVFALHEKIIGCLILIGTFTENMMEEYGAKMVTTAKAISYRLGANADTLYPNGRPAGKQGIRSHT